MAYITNKLNRVLTGGFDILFIPLRSLGPFWALTIVSVLTGLLMVWIFGRISNQDKIRTVKDRIYGNLIGLLLFQKNVGVFFRIQGRLFCLTLRYLGLSLKPMLVMMVPLAVVLIQLNGHFALRPLEVGETAVVTVGVRNAELLRGDPGAVRFEAGDGVVVGTRPVRIPSRREVSWRIRAESVGRHSVTVHAGADSANKLVIVGRQSGFLSSRRPGAGLTDGLLHPGEAPLQASSAITSMAVGYPPLKMSVMGSRVNWLVWFFLCSVVSGYLLKGPLGVDV